MNESGILDTQHEVIDSYDFDNAHPSSPFYTQPLPKSFERLNENEQLEEAYEMGVRAAQNEDGRKSNPFSKSDYRDLYEEWNRGWFLETCGDND
jgi:hypothetical protein